MKTLLLTLEYPPFFGGVSRYYFNIVENWPEKKDIYVLNNNSDKLINKNLPFLKWLPAFFHLQKIVKEEKIEHILIGHILPLGTVAFFLSKIMNFNYSLFLHGMDLALSQKTFRKRWLAKIILDNARTVICTNSQVAEDAEKIIGANDKIKIVNPAIDLSNLNRDIKLEEEIKRENNLDGKFILYTVSRLVKRKGHDRVLEVLPEVLKHAPNLIYAIGGVGPDEEYLKEKASHIEKGKVIFLERIDDKEKWAWFHLCDAFIMPSRESEGDYEGFGIVYIEANLAGKPIIAGDSGGVRDAVIHNYNGLLVEPENNQQIKDAIIKLANDESLRKNLGEQGKARVLKEFNCSFQAAKVFNILKKSK